MNIKDIKQLIYVNLIAFISTCSLVSDSKELKAKKETGGVAFSDILLAQSSNLENARVAEKISQVKLNTPNKTEL